MQDLRWGLKSKESFEGLNSESFEGLNCESFESFECFGSLDCIDFSTGSAVGYDGKKRPASPKYPPKKKACSSGDNGSSLFFCETLSAGDAAIAAIVGTAYFKRSEGFDAKVV